MSDNKDAPRPADKSGPADPDPELHSAALVDENGNEIPITPEMIRQACEQLDADAEDADAGDR